MIIKDDSLQFSYELSEFDGMCGCDVSLEYAAGNSVDITDYTHTHFKYQLEIKAKQFGNVQAAELKALTLQYRQVISDKPDPTKCIELTKHKCILEADVDSVDFSLKGCGLSYELTVLRGKFNPGSHDNIEQLWVEMHVLPQRPDRKPIIFFIYFSKHLT